MPAEFQAIRDQSSSRRSHAPEKVLAVDLGTSYFKVGLFNHRGELEVLKSTPVPTTITSDGRVELEVIAFRDCITDAVRSVAKQAGGLHEVRAVSFATQANSFALFDAAYEPLTPFILWSDRRAKDEQSVLSKLVNLPEFYETTGVVDLNHLFLPAKLSWLRRHEPRLTYKTARIAHLSDYLSWWLSGHWSTEAAVAGLTGLANIHSLEWSPAALSVAEIDVQQLPRIVRAGTSAGKVLSEVARAWGLPQHCEFVAGCLDQFASAIGARNTDPGKISETTGTVMATIRCSSSFDRSLKGNVFQGPGFRKGLYYQMLFSELSAGLLERYRNTRVPNLTFAQLDQMAATIPPGSEGLTARADAFHHSLDECFEGRAANHTPAHETRAILEAVANELARQVRALTGGVTPERVFAGGGASRSELWLRIKSEAVGCPVVPVDCDETACRGAAWLALSTINGTSVEQLANATINS